jgi:hypothetical protein
MKTFLFLSLFASLLYSYPEMVRHGYPKCLTCHHSPDGGGLLTSYGRVISSELLSTWGNEQASKSLGVLEPNRWFEVGGDVRFAQSYSNLLTVGDETYRFFLMQADAEAALKYNGFKLVGSIGYMQNSLAIGSPDTIVSRRHYLLYNLAEWSFRVGKFPLAYGIHIAEHTTEIKQSLGWDQNTEPYAIEVSWYPKGYEVFATVSMGNLRVGSETSLTLRGAYTKINRMKIGLSAHGGVSTVQTRVLGGPYAIIGITPRLFLLTEWDFQLLMPTGFSSSLGLYSYNRLDYEFVQGAHIYIGNQIGQSSFLPGTLGRFSYFAGLQWFVFPHLELYGLVQRQYSQILSAPTIDVILAMAHIYL